MFGPIDSIASRLPTYLRGNPSSGIMRETTMSGRGVNDLTVRYRVSNALLYDHQEKILKYFDLGRRATVVPENAAIMIQISDFVFRQDIL